MGVTLEGKKKKAKKEAVKGDEVSQSRIDELEDQVISDYMNEFNISEEEAITSNSSCVDFLSDKKLNI